MLYSYSLSKDYFTKQTVPVPNPVHLAPQPVVMVARQPAAMLGLPPGPRPIVAAMPIVPTVALQPAVSFIVIKIFLVNNPDS